MTAHLGVESSNTQAHLPRCSIMPAADVPDGRLISGAEPAVITPCGFADSQVGYRVKAKSEAANELAFG